MMKYVRLAVAVLAVCFAFPAWGASVLIGTSNGTVGVLSTATGVLSNQFMLGTTAQPVALFDIAQDPNGSVFALNGANTLIEIDLATQSSSTVGSFAAGVEMNALAFGPGNVLYGTNRSQLFTINTSTGAATLVGDIGQRYASSGDIAFAPGGVLYGTSRSGCTGLFDCLFSIDPTTGAGTRIGSFGSFSRVLGLAFADGTLFGMTSDNLLFTYNLATGQVSNPINFGTLNPGIGATRGATALVLLPAPVPLPAAFPLLLAALGFFGLIARRRVRTA